LYQIKSLFVHLIFGGLVMRKSEQNAPSAARTENIMKGSGNSVSATKGAKKVATLANILQIPKQVAQKIVGNN
jgi:hypothetical protein